MDEQSTGGQAPRRRSAPPETLLTIGEVVEALRPHYPDVSISSLRFLEREGLLTPQRTPGGHRLFSPRDVERVRRVKELQRRRHSLEEIRRQLRTIDEFAGLHSLAEQYLRMILAGGRRGALDLVQRASDAGIAAEDLYLKVITPAMTEV